MSASDPSAGIRLSPHRRKRLLVEYLRATRNEIAIDERAAHYAGQSLSLVGHIPRPGLWMGKALMRPVVSRTVAGLASAVWRVTRGLPFHLLKAVTLARRARRLGKPALPTPGTPIGLALSRRAMEVIARPAMASAPATWIVPPWVDAQGLGSGLGLIDAMALLPRGGFRQAFFLSLAATAAMARRQPFSRWILQSYTAMPWFCLRLALLPLRGPLFMAEHFDRWAVLADSHAVAQRRARRLDPSEHETTLTLVQHGEVASLSGGGDVEALPYRLDAVKGLHVYDAEAERVFRERILTSRCASAVDVHHFAPTIPLFETPRAGVFRILFVGHPVCAALHVAIHSAVSGDATIRAYYKPHPAAGSADMTKEQDWTMLTNQSGFPEVDALIAYPSTLVREYAMHGITAFVHPLAVQPADQEATVAAAVTFIDGAREARQRGQSSPNLPQTG